MSAYLNGDPYKNSELEVPVAKFAPQYQAYKNGPWSRPSVGGIDEGLDTVEEAQNLIDMLLRHDRNYYGNAKWRIIKITREVVTVPPTDADSDPVRRTS